MLRETILILNLAFSIIKNSTIEESITNMNLTKQKKSKWVKKVERNQIGERPMILNFTIDANIELLIQMRFNLSLVQPKLQALGHKLKDDFNYQMRLFI